MTDHITLAENTDHGLRCQHCAGIYTPTLPATVERHISALRGFVLMHKHCPPKVVPSKQVELFDALVAKEKEKELQRRADMFSNAIDVLVPEPTTSPVLDSISDAGNRILAEIAAAQAIAGIDGMSDEPDPETDPPGYGEPGPGTSLSGPQLNAFELRYLITCVRPKEFWPTLKEVETWHQDVRTRVQDWCRIEHAHAHPIQGMTLPERGPLPNVLAALEFPHPKKPKKGARPLTSGKRRGKGVEG